MEQIFVNVFHVLKRVCDMCLTIAIMASIWFEVRRWRMEHQGTENSNIEELKHEL